MSFSWDRRPGLNPGLARIFLLLLYHSWERKAVFQASAGDDAPRSRGKLDTGGGFQAIRRQ